LLDIKRFKNEEFEFISARDEYLWIVEVNFVVWFRLEFVANFRFEARSMLIQTFHEISSSLADVKRSA